MTEEINNDLFKNTLDPVKQAMADAEGDLTDTTTTRDADVKYLADLTAVCKLKPADFESRQQLRTKSLKWSRRQSRSCPAMTRAATR